MTVLKVGSAVVVMFICASQLLAQHDSPSPQYEASGFGGGSFIGDFDFPTSVSGSASELTRTVGLHYASGYQIGVRINENLRNFWAADLEYSFANQPFRLTNLSPRIQNLTLGQSIHHFSYSVSCLPLGHLDHFQPYGKIGVGSTYFYIHSSSRDEASALGLSLENTWKFSFNFGGGFKYVVNDETALVFDVKDYVTGIPSYGLPYAAQVVSGQYQPGFSRTGVLHNLQLNVGVAFRFDDW